MTQLKLRKGLGFPQGIFTPYPGTGLEIRAWGGPAVVIPLRASPREGKAPRFPPTRSVPLPATTYPAPRPLGFQSPGDEHSLSLREVGPSAFSANATHPAVPASLGPQPLTQKPPTLAAQWPFLWRMCSPEENVHVAGPASLLPHFMHCGF